MSGDGYLIYQLHEDAGNVKFASLEQMKEKGIMPDRSLYEPVYVAPLDNGDKTLHERRIGLAAIVGNAVHLEAKISSLLLQSIFYPNSPLHDGAVIIQDGKITAAHAILPLTQEPDYSHFGTRHRAALGITEETDAVALVVSEETGTISYAYRGKLSRDVSKSKLTEFLKRKLLEQKTLMISDQEEPADAGIE